MRFSVRPGRLRYQLVAFLTTRAAINTTYRLVYPFLPALARGLGVDIQTIALAITARSSLGIAGPFIGSAADFAGRKRGMLAGLSMVGAGLVLVSLRPSFATFLAMLLLTASGKILFDPSMQAYLGDRVGYAQRGLAIAATEIGWSSAFLLGMPVVGWLISRGGWTAPFPWLLVCTLAALAVLAAWLPSDGPRDTKGSSVGRHVRAVLRHPAAVGGLALSALLSFANETVSIVYGVWMEGRFGLQVAALGAASAVIGIAELGGEGLVAALADRLGKRRAVALGILLNALAALALPRIATSTITALLALFAFYLTFEFTVVSVLPLMTELVPAARATMMAANLAAFSLGRSLGALSGPRLYAGGMAANVAVAAVLNAAALVILIVLVREEPDIRPIDA